MADAEVQLEPVNAEAQLEPPVNVEDAAEDAVEEELQPQDFYDWLNDDIHRSLSDVWLQKPDGGVTKILGMSKTFLKLFNGVLDYLNAIHGKDMFDGDLRHNIRIESEGTGAGLSRVSMVVRFSGIPRGGTEEEVGRGILSDVTALRMMVSALVKKFPIPASQQPMCLSFFWDEIYKPRKYMTLNEIKEIAFYNYSHPLFFDKIKAVHFVYKVYEIRNRDTVTFDSFIALNGYYPRANMTGWTSRIPVDRRFPPTSEDQPPLRKLLYDRREDSVQRRGGIMLQDRYRNSIGIPIYMRVVGEHGRDDLSDRGESNGKLMKELLRALPDALPKLHYVLCLVFVVEGYAEEFGDSLPNLLRSGHWGYKGFKF